MPHAVDRDHAASRAKDDIAVGQITPLDICKAEARCDLPDPAGREVQFVQVKIVFRFRFAPREQNSLTIVGKIRITDHTARVLQQNAFAVVAIGHLENTQLGAWPKAVSVLVHARVIAGKGVRTTSFVLVPALDKQDLCFALNQRCESFRTRMFAHVQIELKCFVGGWLWLDFNLAKPLSETGRIAYEFREGFADEVEGKRIVVTFQPRRCRGVRHVLQQPVHLIRIIPLEAPQHCSPLRPRRSVRFRNTAQPRQRWAALRRLVRPYSTHDRVNHREDRCCRKRHAHCDIHCFCPSVAKYDSVT